MKVHLLNEGYAYIPKMRDFTEDSKEEILGNQGFRAREASYPCYYCGLLWLVVCFVGISMLQLILRIKLSLLEFE